MIAVTSPYLSRPVVKKRRPAPPPRPSEAPPTPARPSHWKRGLGWGALLTAAATGVVLTPGVIEHHLTARELASACPPPAAPHPNRVFSPNGQHSIAYDDNDRISVDGGAPLKATISNPVMAINNRGDYVVAGLGGVSAGSPWHATKTTNILVHTDAPAVQINADGNWMVVDKQQVYVDGVQRSPVLPHVDQPRAQLSPDLQWCVTSDGGRQCDSSLRDMGLGHLQEGAGISGPRLQKETSSFMLSYWSDDQDREMHRILDSPAVAWDRPLTGWSQGTEGNCASIAVIKGSMAHFGKYTFQSVSQDEAGDWHVVLRDGKKVTLSRDELKLVASNSGFFNSHNESATTYATFSYAVMAKRHMVLEDYHSLRGSLNKMNNGLHTQDVFDYLGIEKYVHDADGKVRPNDIVARGDGHAIFITRADGQVWSDAHGRAVTYNGTNTCGGDLTDWWEIR